MATQGPLSPGTTGTVTRASGITWANVGNIAASDDARANASLPGVNFTDYLVARNFGFSIPAGATIDGIKAEIECSSDSANVANLYPVELSKDAGSTAAGDTGSSAGINTDDGYRVFGGPINLWTSSGPVTWNDSEINSANFAVRLAAEIFSGGPATALIDHVRVTVYYTVPPPYQAKKPSFQPFIAQ